MTVYARFHWALLGSTVTLGLVALAEGRTGWFVADVAFVGLLAVATPTVERKR